MMLLLRLMQFFHLAAARRRIDGAAALDMYFTSLKQLAWPRLHAILDAHVESLRVAPAQSRDVHPHYVCFIHMMLSI